MNKNIGLPPERKGAFWTTESTLAYFLVLPAIAVLVAFMFYPIVYVFLTSLYKTNRLGNLVKFIGTDNFETLFSDKEFWEVTIRSVIWTVLAVSAKTLAGLVIALLLNVDFKGRKLARTLVILPWASSVPISAMLWLWVYNYMFGLLNYTLEITGLWKNPPHWLAYPLSGFLANLYVDIWIGIPFMALVFLAGLQTIPKELYEAAEIDGAGSFTKFLLITLPQLGYVVFIVTLFSTIWTLAMFETAFIITQGGPMNSTHLFSTFTYQIGIALGRLGEGTAISLFMFPILIVLMYLELRYVRKGA